MPDFNLDRFKKAQSRDYATALTEIKNGRKESHWMWYIFPQLKGLGFSSMAEFYGIDGLAEAKAYFADDLLRGRLVEISEALLSLPSSDAREVMGYPDDLKLKSCMTLFMVAAPELEVFGKVLEKFFGGEKDLKTLEMVKRSKEPNLAMKFGEVMPDSRLTEPSDGKVFRLREAIILSKKLGRPLTKEEMEEFTL